MNSTLSRLLKHWMCTLLAMLLVLMVGVLISVVGVRNFIFLNDLIDSVNTAVVRYGIYVMSLFVAPNIIELVKLLKTKQNLKPNKGNLVRNALKKPNKKRQNNQVRIKLLLLIVAYEVLVIINPLAWMMEVAYGR